MKHMQETCGCPEYAMWKRRDFLGISGGSVAALLAAPAWLPKVAYAQSAVSGRDVIVVIFLRGGCDGLTLCVPHGDDDYYALRPTLAIPRPDSTATEKATDLDGFFGLAPAMSPLLGAYNAGQLLMVHATGQTDGTRSHFDAMRFMELGKPRDPNIFTGWLGRHLLSSPPTDANAILRAIAIADALPQSLIGAPQALPVPDPAEFGLDGLPNTEQARLDALMEMYGNADNLLRLAAENTINTMNLLDAIDFAGYSPANGALYPDTGFGTSIKSAAALIKAQAGVEAISVDLGGWDTHSGQGPISGPMANLMGEFAETLAAFHADVIQGGFANVTVLVMSEFGRMAPENASEGTDHGHGNCMVLMGGSILGGRVLSNWPGLGAAELYQGQDLDVTIDYRDIVAEIVSKRLGNPNLADIFPDYSPTFHGVA
ncbi:MAG: hypothetical protein AMXMBFR84_20850 [Candidatus Hydrogenedentota bacterium]